MCPCHWVQVETEFAESHTLKNATHENNTMYTVKIFFADAKEQNVKWIGDGTTLVKAEDWVAVTHIKWGIKSKTKLS